MKFLVLALMISFLSLSTFGGENRIETTLVEKAVLVEEAKLKLNDETIETLKKRVSEEYHLLLELFTQRNSSVDENIMIEAWQQSNMPRAGSPISICDYQTLLNRQSQLDLDGKLQIAVFSGNNETVKQLLKKGVRALTPQDRVELSIKYSLAESDAAYEESEDSLCQIITRNCMKSITKLFYKIRTKVRGTQIRIYPL